MPPTGPLVSGRTGLAVRFVGALFLALALGLALGAGNRPAAARPAAPGDAPVVPQSWLPVLGSLGTDDGCRSWIAVQNLGPRPSKAVLVAFTNSRDCGPACDEVQGVECSGLIHPGGTWHFLGAQIPFQASSGIVFSFADLRRSDPALGLAAGDEDLVVDALCATLLQARDCASYAQFKAAADAGGEFAGLPLDRLAGSPLAVTVLRNCPGDFIPGVEVAGAYGGAASAQGGSAYDAASGRYRSYAAPLRQPASGTTVLHVQNVGSACATVELWVRGRGQDCTEDRLCESVAIAPGAAAHWEAAACVEIGWSGTAWVSSDQPVALALDEVGFDMLTTVTGGGAVPLVDAAGQPALSAPGTILHAALVYDRAAGWRTDIEVQNLSHDEPGRARVAFLDAKGQELQASEVELCPHGSAAAALEPTGSVAGGGLPPVSAQVTSLSVNGADPVPLAAVARTSYLDDQSPLQPRTAGAYELVPDRLALPVTEPGVGVLAVPNLPTDLQGVGLTSELAVQNLVRLEGYTDVAVLVYDRNDLVGTRCERLDAGEVTYLDLSLAPIAGTGIHGDAVVSALFWQHPDPATGQNMLGLAAVLALRTGTAWGFDIPGDELALSTGVPLRVSPVRALSVGGQCPQLPPPPLPPGAGQPPVTGAVFLPVLSFQGQDSVCEVAVTVTNGGAEPAKAVLLAHEEPGFCGPGCSGPLTVACSGLMAPRGTWIFATGEPFIDDMAAMVYGFNTRTMTEVGVPAGGDMLVADWICAQGGLAMDCGRARQLHLSYLTGATFQGIPLDQVDAGPLRAAVLRECPDLSVSGMIVASTYAGLSGEHFDPDRAPEGGYFQSAAVVSADAEGRNTFLYIQNAGSSCASVTLSFRALGQCEGGHSCSVFTLAPLEALAFDVSDCVGPDFNGTVYLHSTEPLAIAADTLGESVQRSWDSPPSWSPYDLDDNGLVNEDDLNVLLRALGSTPATANWNPRADLDHDLAVEWADRVLFERGGLCRTDIPTETPGATDTPGPSETPEPTSSVDTATPGSSPTLTPTAGTRTLTPPPSASPTAGLPPAEEIHLPFAQKGR
jgi:hypothetical protein